jgi:hypothetical protein
MERQTSRAARPPILAGEVVWFFRRSHGRPGAMASFDGKGAALRLLCD